MRKKIHCPINDFEEETKFHTCLTEIQKYGKSGINKERRVKTTEIKFIIEEIGTNEFVIHSTEIQSMKKFCNGKQSLVFLSTGTSEVKIDRNCEYRVHGHVLIHTPKIDYKQIIRIPFDAYEIVEEDVEDSYPPTTTLGQRSFWQ